MAVCVGMGWLVVQVPVSAEHARACRTVAGAGQVGCVHAPANVGRDDPALFQVPAGRGGGVHHDVRLKYADTYVERGLHVVTSLFRPGPPRTTTPFSRTCFKYTVIRCAFHLHEHAYAPFH